MDSAAIKIVVFLENSGETSHEDKNLAWYYMKLAMLVSWMYFSTVLEPANA